MQSIVMGFGRDLYQKLMNTNNNWVGVCIRREFCCLICIGVYSCVHCVHSQNRWGGPRFKEEKKR
jgi:hypothetical protein